MKYNTKYSDDKAKAIIYFEKLLSNNKRIEIKEIRTARTNSQNRYLHALFALFGVHYGLDIDESKQVVKTALKCVYEKKGKTFLKKTSKMNTKEISDFIERFRMFSSEQGCYLPDADEFNGRYEYYDNVIDQHKNYL